MHDPDLVSADLHGNIANVDVGRQVRIIEHRHREDQAAMFHRQGAQLHRAIALSDVDCRDALVVTDALIANL